MKFLTIALLVVVSVLFFKGRLLSFRAQSPSDYAETGPSFDLRENLAGDILSEGIIYGPKGRMTSSFTALMRGEWDGDTGTLSEEFTYSSGVTQSRKWYLTLTSDTTFTAEADDIVGTGQGVISGSTIRLKYKIRLPESSGGHVLDAIDWMYLTDNGVIMNKSEMRKFGIKVAELVATMRPDISAEASAAAAE